MHRSQCSPLKCVLVGNAAVGKTSLIVAYTTNGFRETYRPTAFDNYSVTVNVDNKPLRMDLCDTAGNSRFDTLRPLSYSEADVFLLCFKVSEPESLTAVTEHWLPELKTVCPNVPVILVGTQNDQRMGYERRKLLVDSKRVKRLADQLELDYIECSALTQLNLKEVFDLAILNAMKNSAKIRSNKVPEKARERQPTFKNSFRRLVSMTKKFL
ncbi:unnamed protein product [Bursaphelenchus xylophilus]|uniref:(pine wood nematode) hypothetical protein n=1 Tax=Bursaphelenchus xylophilus TaxID=6326 RepID=A0A1I7S2N6_BURXY|nr:unnamed protein product [Bursaphelenchus xylophilus]CAG9121790.1 unnamed protein product [Bursaphelenchus xylophilus]